jgi:hypothetical protein
VKTDACEGGLPCIQVPYVGTHISHSGLEVGIVEMGAE